MATLTSTLIIVSILSIPASLTLIALAAYLSREQTETTTHDRPGAEP